MAPWGSPDVHVAVVAISPDADRLAALVDQARAAYQQVPGIEAIWRQDAYALADERTSFGFKDGISHPAVEGSGIPGTNSKEAPIKAGEFLLGYPTETEEMSPVPLPEVLAATHIRRRPQAAHEVAAFRLTSARRRTRPRRSPRRQDGGAGPARAVVLAPEVDDPSRCRPERNNDSLQGRRPSRPHCRRRPCPAHETADAEIVGIRGCTV